VPGSIRLLTPFQSCFSRKIFIFLFCLFTARHDELKSEKLSPFQGGQQEWVMVEEVEKNILMGREQHDFKDSESRGRPLRSARRRADFSAFRCSL
jgi:hypothetical protein